MKKDIPYSKEFKSVKEIIIPEAYIIPKGFWPIIELLRRNNTISYRQLKNDTIIEVESYKIADFKTTNSAYEGHYLHRNTTITSTMQQVAFAKGDYVIPTQQKGIKDLLETLEPEAIYFLQSEFFRYTIATKRRLFRIRF